MYESMLALLLLLLVLTIPSASGFASLPSVWPTRPTSAPLMSLSKVSLESSRSYEFRGKNAREYKVSFVADLEKRWRLPEIAVVAEAGESKP